MFIDKVTIEFAKKQDFYQIDSLLNEISDSIRTHEGKWKNYAVKAKKENRREIFKNTINSNNKIFVARTGNELVGVINMQLVSNIRHGWVRAHLEEVVVRKGYRNKGIGTKLISAVKDYCKKNNIKVIKLFCGNQLKDANRFYRKNGFKNTDKGYRYTLR